MKHNTLQETSKESEARSVQTAETQSRASQNQNIM